MEISEIKQLAENPRDTNYRASDSLQSVPKLVELYALADKEDAEGRVQKKPQSRFDSASAGRRVKEGQRNTALFSLAGTMRRRSMSEEAILAALTEENRVRCSPPLSEGEVSDIASGVGRYKPEDPFFAPSSLPEFPLEALPYTLRRMVEETAAAMVCPPEFVAIPTLATLGSAIGNSRVLRLKSGWTEGAAPYAVVIADPGAKKSPALKSFRQ